jgi:hypothetical protein
MQCREDIKSFLMHLHGFTEIHSFSYKSCRDVLKCLKSKLKLLSSIINCENYYERNRSYNPENYHIIDIKDQQRQEIK